MGEHASLSVAQKRTVLYNILLRTNAPQVYYIDLNTMNLQLVRLLRHEITDEFYEEFKKVLVLVGETIGGGDSSMHDTAIQIIEQLHSLPESQLNEWFDARTGKNWDIIFDGLIKALSALLRSAHLEDDKWQFSHFAN